MRILSSILIAILCASCSPKREQTSPAPAKKAPVSAKQDPIGQQLVRLHIPLKGDSGTKEAFAKYAALEDVLDAAATKAGVGELDGNEMGEGEYTIWLYGRDATKLAEVVKSALKGRALPKGSKLFLRHGGVNDSTAKKETIAVDN